MADENPIRYNSRAFKAHKHTTEKNLTVLLPREIVAECKRIAAKKWSLTARKVVEMAVREYLARIKNGRVKL